MNIVISQSMYFPWIGLLEQIRLADIVVHYDDVDFTRGFFNRVQLKTSSGPGWLTVPTHNYHRGQHIDEVQIDETQDWKKQHLDALKSHYAGATHRDDMLKLVKVVFSQKVQTISQISRASIFALTDYFDLREGRRFISSTDLHIGGKSSVRLRDICQALGGDTYITGHGAAKYLDHAMFDASGIAVRYMDYQMSPYPQLHGRFIPFVSALDLVANCGPDGRAHIRSDCTAWKEFLR